MTEMGSNGAEGDENADASGGNAARAREGSFFHSLAEGSKLAKVGPLVRRQAMDTSNSLYDAQMMLGARAARGDQFGIVFGVGFLGWAACLFFVLAYGAAMGGAAKLAVAALIIIVTVYTALGGRAALREIKAVNQDYSAACPGTKFAAELGSVTMDLFIGLTIGLSSLTGLAQLYALFG
jgi:hypothetical protein